MSGSSADRAGGALLVVGATSGAGKSTVAAALCRSWARRGRDVAPFKAQNMSNHAAVTADGGEVGRAQATQARAARVDVERAMNPVLLKPSADGSSHLVVMGDEVGRAGARDYGDTARDLRPVVLQAYAGLRREHGWLVAEGAGGAAEINLLDRDLVNLPLAAAAGCRAVLVVDVDRGGSFAAAHGTLALLPPALRERVGGVVFNRLRGDASLFADGFAAFEAVAGVPVLGVLPHLGPEPLLGVEDSLDLDDWLPGARPAESDPLRVAVLRLPHLANPSDLDPLLVEPGVEVAWATRAGDLAAADLVLLPGSRATLADLDWVRARGLDRAVVAAAERGATVLGVCAGYQMLGRWIDDPIESGRGRVPGLGLLPVTTSYEAPKTVRRTGTGYEIHWGRVRADADAAGDAWRAVGEAEPRGWRHGCVRGTSVHGLLDDDRGRAALLAEVADRAGRDWRPGAQGFADVVDAQLDGLADWLEAHVDVAALDRLAREAAGPGEEPGWAAGRAGVYASGPADGLDVDHGLVTDGVPDARGVLWWRFAGPRPAVSSASVGGGLREVSWVLNLGVHHDYRRHDLDAHAADVVADLARRGTRLGGAGAALLTAVPVERRTHHDEDGVRVWATTGVTRPTWPADRAALATAGERLPGTVNLVVVLPAALSDAALVQAALTATEAKAQACVEAGLPGTGTASDAVVVVCAPRTGEVEDFGGVRSRWGSRVALAVHAAVAEGLRVHP